MKNRMMFGLGLSFAPRWRSVSIVVLLLLSASHAAGALDKTMSLGRDQLWQGLAKLDGVVLQTGQGGFPVLALRTNEYTPNESTDLLLHFDQEPPTDAAGDYRTTTSTISISQKWARLGTGAGVFQGQQTGVELVPSAPDALFEPGKEWHDFTIEFWFYPATLSDGETLFLWRGARKENGTIVPQSIRCDVEGNRLTWTLANFFQPPSQGAFTLTLRGADDLIPRQWHHHTLRFNSRTGMLEYLIDGQPAAIAYANDADAENGTVFMPRVGTAAESRIRIGDGLTGFLDELRVSSGFIKDPNITRYGLTPGAAVTKPIDLGYTDSTVHSISVNDITPGNTAVFYFYRAANQLSSADELSGKWVQFAPNAPLPSAPRGRYVQFKIELLPDGSGKRTPTVNDLSFSYQPQLPPPAPALLTATPGNGSITLSWRKVVDSHLKGYELFYGDRPGQYFGTDSSSGQSPIDVGNTTSFDLKGLTNGKLYYIAVVTCDNSTPPHQSPFSNEVAARPSAITGPGQ